MIPKDIISKGRESLWAAIDAGFGFNTKANGKWLKRYTTKPGARGGIDGSHTGHKKYNAAVDEVVLAWESNLDNLDEAGNFDPQKAKKFYENLANKLDDLISDLEKTAVQNPNTKYTLDNTELLNAITDLKKYFK